MNGYRGSQREGLTERLNIRCFAFAAFYRSPEDALAQCENPLPCGRGSVTVFVAGRLAVDGACFVDLFQEGDGTEEGLQMFAHGLAGLIGFA
jgi:hypothetical protein